MSMFFVSGKYEKERKKEREREKRIRNFLVSMKFPRLIIDFSLTLASKKDRPDTLSLKLSVISGVIDDKIYLSV